MVYYAYWSDLHIWHLTILNRSTEYQRTENTLFLSFSLPLTHFGPKNQRALTTQGTCQNTIHSKWRTLLDWDCLGPKLQMMSRLTYYVRFKGPCHARLHYVPYIVQQYFVLFPNHLLAPKKKDNASQQRKRRTDKRNNIQRFQSSSKNDHVVSTARSKRALFPIKSTPASVQG